MTKSIRPANAGAITRSLVAAGFRRGEEHKASRGMVRGGWSTFTEVRQGSYRDGTPRYGWLTNNTPTGYVVVEYQFGSWDRRGQAERNAKAAEVLDRAAEHLRTKGFEVEVTKHAITDEPRLHVCRCDADGNVVKF